LSFLSIPWPQIILFFIAATVTGLVQSKDWHRIDMCSPHIPPFLGYVCKVNKLDEWVMRNS
jgi:hypothetical protein